MTASDSYWVLVTASRYYASPGRICEVLTEIEEAHPGRPLVLVHGMCDPRQPVTHHAIRWNAATKLSHEDQGCLLGGDWLSDWIVRPRPRWRIERHPASSVPGGPLSRNETMVARMLANGASEGDGECAAFTGPCEKAACTITGPHNSHGTSHCLARAHEAGIPVRAVPGDR
jgi:hypothetical protein